MKTKVRKCPMCLSDTEVIDSRLQKDGEIMRRRRCLKCGYRFKSVEINADDYIALTRKREYGDAISRTDLIKMIQKMPRVRGN